MSFVKRIQQSDKFQLMEVEKNGMSYLLILTANQADDMLRFLEETGKIHIDEKTILWSGKGGVPDYLDDALTQAGLGKQN